MSQKLVIRVLNGTQQGRKFALENLGEYQLGRSPDGDIILPDTSVSGRHASLSHDGQYWYLRDLGSRNGTTVNNLPIAQTPVALPPQGVLCFASIQAQFWHEPPQQRPAPWPPPSGLAAPGTPPPPPSGMPPIPARSAPPSSGFIQARGTLIESRGGERAEPSRTMPDTPIPAWPAAREWDNLADPSGPRGNVPPADAPRSLLGDVPRQDAPRRDAQPDPRAAASLWNVPAADVPTPRPPTPPAVPLQSPPRSDPKLGVKPEAPASLWDPVGASPVLGAGGSAQASQPAAAASSAQPGVGLPSSLASLLNDWKPPAINPEPPPLPPPQGAAAPTHGNSAPPVGAVSLFAELEARSGPDHASPWSSSAWSTPEGEGRRPADALHATRASLPVDTALEPSASAQSRHEGSEPTPTGWDGARFESTARTPWADAPQGGPLANPESTRTSTLAQGVGVTSLPMASAAASRPEIHSAGPLASGAGDEPPSQSFRLESAAAARLDTDRQRLAQELERAQAELAAELERSQNLRTQQESLLSDLDAARTELTTLRQSSKSETERLQQEVSGLSEALQSARMARGEEQALKLELQQLQQEQERLKATLQDAQQERQTLASELLALKEASGVELQRATQEVARLTADLQAARQGGSAELQRATQEVARLSADLQAARQGGSAEMQRLQGELTRVTSDMQTLRQAVGAEVQRLQQELLKAQGELGRAQPEFVRLQTENASIRQQAQERTQEVEALKAKVQSLQQGLQEADQLLKGGGRGPDATIHTVFRQSIAFLESFGESLEALAACLAAGTDPGRARQLLREISYKLGDLRGILEEGRRLASAR